MSYGQNLRGKLKQIFESELDSLDVESSDIYSEDLALISAKITMLLQTAKKAPSQADLDKLIGLFIVIESQLEDVKTQLIRLTDTSAMSDEYILLVAAIARAKAFAENMKLSEQSWKEIRELQEQKRRYIESQREHNRTRTGEKMTKAEFERQKEELFRAIINAVDDNLILDRIFGNIGVDRKLLK